MTHKTLGQIIQRLSSPPYPKVSFYVWGSHLAPSSILLQATWSSFSRSKMNSGVTKWSQLCHLHGCEGCLSCLREFLDKPCERTECWCTLEELSFFPLSSSQPNIPLQIKELEERRAGCWSQRPYKPHLRHGQRCMRIIHCSFFFSKVYHWTCPIFLLFKKANLFSLYGCITDVQQGWDTYFFKIFYCQLDVNLQ